MKLLNVSRDQKYLYIYTDEGVRKQSLSWRTVDQLETKCRALIGQAIIHSTSGSWDKSVWFQDVSLSQVGQNVVTPIPSAHRSIADQFPLGKTWDSRTVKRIFGPPGTGKTTRLVSIAKDAIQGGVP